MIKCNVIRTPGWELHIFPDGIRVLPPPAWTLELIGLIESKTINHAAAKIVLETWQRDAIRRITAGLEAYRRLEN